ncbi:MAG: AMP-binding protein [Chloroflexi bacterium]|nr:AMP-binding protein [Chloroflexota bacterium]
MQLDPQAPAAQTLANLQTEPTPCATNATPLPGTPWLVTRSSNPCKPAPTAPCCPSLSCKPTMPPTNHQWAVNSPSSSAPTAWNGSTTRPFSPQKPSPPCKASSPPFLDNIAEGNGRSLAQTSLLTEAQYQQLIFDWNATTTEYDHSACMHSLIEAQAAQRPQAIALVHRQQQITYGELNQRANRLARYLIKAGVGPDVIVGVYLERDIDLMVALIGIHKAGGAYLPLDPDYPQDRLAFMVEDAAVPVLLTKAQFSSSLPPSRAGGAPRRRLAPHRSTRRQ